MSHAPLNVSASSIGLQFAASGEESKFQVALISSHISRALICSERPSLRAMHLPKPSGPFEVGIIDLELPVREPRDFVPKYLDRVRLNRLSKNGHKMSKKKSKKVYDALHSSISTDETEELNLREAEGAYLKDQGLGLRSSTLHFRTVLFSLYYPSTDLPPSKVKKYHHAHWLGQYVFDSDHQPDKENKQGGLELSRRVWMVRAHFFPCHHEIHGVQVLCTRGSASWRPQQSA